MQTSFYETYAGEIDCHFLFWTISEIASFYFMKWSKFFKLESIFKIICSNLLIYREESLFRRHDSL